MFLGLLFILYVSWVIVYFVCLLGYCVFGMPVGLLCGYKGVWCGN